MASNVFSIAWFGLMGIGLVMPVGCDRAAPANLANNEAAAPVDRLAEAVDSPKKFRELFCGAAPSDAERKRYGEYAFQVARIRSVSDSEAVLNVTIDDGKADHPSEVEWTVAKDGGKWKLKAAPLP